MALLDDHTLLAIHEPERLPALLPGPQVLNRPREDRGGHESRVKSFSRDVMHARRPASGTLLGTGADTLWHAHFPFGPRASTVSGRHLTAASTERGLPLRITVDNGTEFTSRMLDHWAVSGLVDEPGAEPADRPPTLGGS